MSTRPHKNDIPIGESRWIEFIDLEGRYNEAVEIDPLLAELSPLWQALEQHCVADCCGFDAFDFYPEAIASAADEMNAESLHESLTNAIRQIQVLENTVVMSTRLNNLADKKTFLDLLSHIQSCIHLAQ